MIKKQTWKYGLKIVIYLNVKNITLFVFCFVLSIH